MTNKDVVIKVLNEHPCLAAMEVRQFAKRLYDYDITPQAVAGAMKPLIAAGLAASGVRHSALRLLEHSRLIITALAWGCTDSTRDSNG